MSPPAVPGQNAVPRVQLQGTLLLPQPVPALQQPASHKAVHNQAQHRLQQQLASRQQCVLHLQAQAWRRQLHGGQQCTDQLHGSAGTCRQQPERGKLPHQLRVPPGQPARVELRQGDARGGHKSGWPSTSACSDCSYELCWTIQPGSSAAEHSQSSTHPRLVCSLRGTAAHAQLRLLQQRRLLDSQSAGHCWRGRRQRLKPIIGAWVGGPKGQRRSRHVDRLLWVMHHRRWCLLQLRRQLLLQLSRRHLRRVLLLLLWLTLLWRLLLLMWLLLRRRLLVPMLLLQRLLLLLQRQWRLRQMPSALLLLLLLLLLRGAAAALRALAGLATALLPALLQGAAPIFQLPASGSRAAAHQLQGREWSNPGTAV